MDLELAGKVALVTGGSRGLGSAVCRALAAEQAWIAVNYRHQANAAERLAEELQQKWHVPAFAVQADVAQEAAVVTMFDAIQRRLGIVDVVVNNAALCPTCSATELSLARWEDTVRTNLTGTFLVCREMARRLTEVGRGGRIVNIASTAAFLGSTTGHAPYDASKGAMISLTYSLAREFAEQPIAVNAVAPGMMETDMTAETLKVNRAKYLARIPLRRIADPREVADVVTFLASPRAGYMTGTTVNVSGGMLMR